MTLMLGLFDLVKWTVMWPAPETISDSVVVSVCENAVLLKDKELS